MRHRPTRLARTEPQTALEFQTVDLVHHAVDVKRQLRPQRAHARVKIRKRRRAMRDGAMFANGKTECRQRRQQFPVRGGQCPALDRADAVSEKAQRAAFGNRRIKLADAARRAVSGIHQWFFATGHRLFVIPRQIIPPHIGFAAHFQQRGRLAPQTQGNVTHGFQILRDILARHAIAPRRPLRQYAVFITQAHGETVKFQFREIFNGQGGLREFQFLANPRVKMIRAAGFGIRFSLDGKHGDGVDDLGKSLQSSPAHAQGRGIGGLQLRVFTFQRLQFAEQGVVVGVGNGGRVVLVIGAVVGIQVAAQSGDALAEGVVHTPFSPCGVRRKFSKTPRSLRGRGTGERGLRFGLRKRLFTLNHCPSPAPAGTPSPTRGEGVAHAEFVENSPLLLRA